MLVSKGQFLRYQNTFYDKLKKTPYYIELEIYEVIKKNTNNDAFDLENFVGDSERVVKKTVKFNALFEREISDRMREKFGLPTEVNGVVYLSPIQLKQKLGTDRLSWQKTKVKFSGRTHVIDRIYYLEEMYNSYVGAQIFVKDDLKS